MATFDGPKMDVAAQGVNHSDDIKHVVHDLAGVLLSE
ncbi:uncharacterized protein G2W53_035205 [Senna tora]|uniref:Uncharacterized protein n=1 Tax=Senna tora TaxID=362788 RepID=A0A834W3S2_9FABA|nr:uncharacterized protein G2W53_035205 [Senna tora]